MPVTDAQVAAFRAYLTKDVRSFQTLCDEIEASGDWGGYAALISAGFFHSVERRFGGAHTRADIIRYVADARQRFSAIGEQFDEVAAEDLIRSVVDDVFPAAHDDGVVAKTEASLVFMLVLDLGLSAEELDALVHQALSDAVDLVD